jgi:predicted RNA-binding Zn-ribbon protein involved in translation (DUF1610 family)
MKMNQTTHGVRGFSLALAVSISVFALVGTANAQSQLGGDSGIAASPKARAQLYERKASLDTAPATVAAMACPKCEDTLVAQNDTNPKGSGSRTLMGQTTKLVSQHLCPGCGVEWVIAGTGKAKQSVAAHKCTSCGAEILSCCAKSIGTVATKGMENTIQIAPLK